MKINLNEGHITPEEWSVFLTDDIRKKFIMEIKEYEHRKLYSPLEINQVSLSDALNVFNWETSKLGYRYWSKINNSIQIGSDNYLNISNIMQINI